VTALPSIEVLQLHQRRVALRRDAGKSDTPMENGELLALLEAALALRKLEAWLRVWHTNRIQDALSLDPLGAPERPLQITLCKRRDDGRPELAGQWTGRGPDLLTALRRALDEAGCK
jgi:hypothetical protein